MELITDTQWIIIFALTTSLTSCFTILLPALQEVFNKKLRNFWNNDWHLFIVTITWLTISTLLFPLFFLILIIPGLSIATIKGVALGLADNENTKV